VVPGLVASGLHVGVKTDVSFPVYASRGSTEEVYSYSENDFDVFKREESAVKELDGKPVWFLAGLGPDKQRWFDHIAEKSDYRCVMLLRPGEDDEYTRNFMLGYILKGSEAEKSWDKYYKKKSRYNGKGIVIKGLAYYLDDSYTYPVAVVVKEVSRD
jgi:hypothetical protein